MNIHYTTQFKKDYKRIKKQNKDLSKIRGVIEKLVSDQELEATYNDHQLSGNWKGHRECHIESDWLLIYQTSSDDLYLEKTDRRLICLYTTIDYNSPSCPSEGDTKIRRKSFRNCSRPVNPGTPGSRFQKRSQPESDR